MPRVGHLSKNMSANLKLIQRENRSEECLKQIEGEKEDVLRLMACKREREIGLVVPTSEIMNFWVDEHLHVFVS